MQMSIWQYEAAFWISQQSTVTHSVFSTRMYVSFNLGEKKYSMHIFM